MGISFRNIRKGLIVRDRTYHLQSPKARVGDVAKRARPPRERLRLHLCRPFGVPKNARVAVLVRDVPHIRGPLLVHLAGLDTPLNH